MKPSSLIVEIHHPAREDAANAVNVKQRELIDINALQGSTLNHENIPQKLRSSNPAMLNARRTSLKVRPHRLCPLCETLKLERAPFTRLSLRRD